MDFLFSAQKYSRQNDKSASETQNKHRENFIFYAAIWSGHAFYSEYIYCNCKWVDTLQSRGFELSFKGSFALFREKLEWSLGGGGSGWRRMAHIKKYIFFRVLSQQSNIWINFYWRKRYTTMQWLDSQLVWHTHDMLFFRFPTSYPTYNSTIFFQSRYCVVTHPIS